MYGAETWTLRAVDKKHLESFGMWCWRRMDKISWTDHVRKEEVLLQVNEQRNILHAIRKRKTNWIGHILRRNCLLKQSIERKIKGEIEVIRRQGRRRKKLLYDLKDRRGYSHLKEEALDRNMCVGIVLEEALNLSSDGLLDDDDMEETYCNRTATATFEVTIKLILRVLVIWMLWYSVGT